MIYMIYMICAMRETFCRTQTPDLEERVNAKKKPDT